MHLFIQPISEIITEKSDRRTSLSLYSSSQNWPNGAFLVCEEQGGGGEAKHIRGHR